jgi:hypothetical protein
VFHEKNERSNIGNKSSRVFYNTEHAIGYYVTPDESIQRSHKPFSLRTYLILSFHLRLNLSST